jgi:uncharacterized damage-inducible protein DinB
LKLSWFLEYHQKDQHMSTLKEFSKELDQESAITRKMLERIPDDKHDWQPHPKSMTIKQLAAHLAELPSWASMAFTTDELDFATMPYNPPVWNNKEELLAIFDKGVAEAREHLSNGKEEDLEPVWKLRNGEDIYMSITKRELVRHALSQTIHHRAQLGVYLRLLDIPVPATYGPSADEQNF